VGRENRPREKDLKGINLLSDAIEIALRDEVKKEIDLKHRGI
jgi:hypothetical protein